MTKTVLTMDKLAPGDVVRLVGGYDKQAFFDFIVIENDLENKVIRFGRPYAVVNGFGRAFTALEDWKLPHRVDMKFYLLSKSHKIE